MGTFAFGAAPVETCFGVAVAFGIKKDRADTEISALDKFTRKGGFSVRKVKAITIPLLKIRIQKVQKVFFSLFNSQTDIK